MKCSCTWDAQAEKPARRSSLNPGLVTTRAATPSVLHEHAAADVRLVSAAEADIFDEASHRCP